MWTTGHSVTARGFCLNNPRWSPFLLAVLTRGEEKEKKTDHKLLLILAINFSLNMLFHNSSKNYKLLY